MTKDRKRNPFTVGQPVAPESFVGHQSLINIAFDQIDSRSNLAVWGGPGMGKLLPKLTDI